MKWLGTMLLLLIAFWYLSGGYARSKTQNSGILTPQKSSQNQVFYDVYGPTRNPASHPGEKMEPIYILQ